MESVWSSNLHALVAYVIYLGVSIALTVWVGRTLFTNGRVFLLHAFNENEKLVDSVNRLLLVGFYLVNVGYVTLALKYGDRPSNPVQVIESLSTKIGLVLVVLGVMHLGNVIGFAKLRKWVSNQRPAPAGGAPYARPWTAAPVEPVGPPPASAVRDATPLTGALAKLGKGAPEPGGQ